MRTKVIFRRVKGSSLVEVLVSLVIIAIVFTIASTIFVNVQLGTESLSKVKAIEKARNIAALSLQQEDWRDAIYRHESYNIEKKLLPYGSIPDLFLLSVDVKSKGGKSAYLYRRLVYVRK